MTFLERRILVFMTQHAYYYSNQHAVQLEMEEPQFLTASAILAQNEQEGWCLSVTVDSDTVKEFLYRHNIRQLADIETITPAMLQELYTIQQGSMIFLQHNTALWFTRSADNTTLVTGDLNAITYDKLSNPEDFVSFSQKLIYSSGLTYPLRIVYSNEKR